MWRRLWRAAGAAARANQKTLRAATSPQAAPEPAVTFGISHGSPRSAGAQETVAAGGAPQAVSAAALYDPVDRCPDASLAVGLQLLPSIVQRYRARWASLLIALDSAMLGLLSPRLFLKLRENHLVVQREPGGHTLFRPILEPRLATELQYEGIRYKTVRSQSLFCITLWVWTLMLVCVIGITVLNLIVGSDRDPFQIMMKVIWGDFVEVIVHAIATGAPALLPAALWAMASSIVLLFVFFLVVLDRVGDATHVNLPPGSITAVAPLIVTPRAPLAMVR